MSAHSASVLQIAQEQPTFGDVLRETPAGWLLTFAVIAGCIVYLGYRWATRPFKKKGK